MHTIYTARPYAWVEWVAAAAMTLTLHLAGVSAGPADTTGPAGGAEVHVGIKEGDIRGGDNRALQAGVDYVAKLGGGTVRIGPGRFQMRNALVLRDNTRVCGVPGKTILVAAAGIK